MLKKQAECTVAVASALKWCWSKVLLKLQNTLAIIVWSAAGPHKPAGGVLAKNRREVRYFTGLGDD